jgi:hypothetical protein
MSDHPFAAEADFVKRATGLPAAIAADLSVAGGILRCEECGGERSADDIAGYLSNGWPSHCGHVMTWVTPRELAFENWGEAPEGYELVAVPDDDWRIEAGRCCRRAGARHKTCGKPSAAAFNRRHTRSYGYGEPSRTVDSWHPRCPGHMGGHWVEGGQVLHWVLRKTEGEGP